VSSVRGARDEPQRRGGAREGEIAGCVRLGRDPRRRPRHRRHQLPAQLLEACGRSRAQSTPEARPGHPARPHEEARNVSPSMIFFFFCFFQLPGGPTTSLPSSPIPSITDDFNTYSAVTKHSVFVSSAVASRLRNLNASLLDIRRARFYLFALYSTGGINVPRVRHCTHPSVLGFNVLA
jgi:hypothetical protein